jgi:hypothetical protein
LPRFPSPEWRRRKNKKLNKVWGISGLNCWNWVNIGGNKNGRETFGKRSGKVTDNCELFLGCLKRAVATKLRPDFSAPGQFETWRPDFSVMGVFKT